MEGLAQTRIGSPKLVVIVLNYNGLRFLKGCFDSLLNQTYPNMDIIMVDNASSDRSVEFVRENFPSIQIVRNAINMGFAEGNNIGIRYALQLNADFVLVLNNDTLLEKTAIRAMVDTAVSMPEVGIVGPLIRDLDNPGIVQELGLDCDVLAYPIPTASPMRGGVVNSFYVSGCAMLIKSQVLVDAGLFDSSYFIFAEDLDLCWRARLAGYQVVATSNATIYHKSGGTVIGGIARGTIHKTSVERLFLSRRNSFQTIVKNYGSMALLLFLPSVVLFYIVSLAAAELLGQNEIGRAYILALFWNIRNMPGTLQRRIAVQSTRRVSDLEIIRKLGGKSAFVRAYFSIGEVEVAKRTTSVSSPPPRKSGP
jgi:GT2 family glycosyltransferase